MGGVIKPIITKIIYKSRLFSLAIPQNFLSCQSDISVTTEGMLKYLFGERKNEN